MQEPEQDGPSGLLVDLVRGVIHAPRLLAQGLRRLRRAPEALARTGQRLGGVWATVAICALAIGLSIASWTRPGLDPFVLDRRAFGGEPWRLVSAHFVHADVIHLLFNLSWIWFLGRAIEQRLGRTLLLGVTLFLMLGGSAAERAFDRGAIGLSGVVYGLWALLFVGQRHCDRLRGILTTKVNRLMIVWFFFCIFATVTGMLPISNWGHGAGAALGALVGLGLRADGRVRLITLPFGVVLLGVLACGATVWWPAWNFGGAALEYEREGFEALERSDWTAAESALRTALRCDARDEGAWWNLGYVLSKQGRREEGVEACYRAFACGGLDTKYNESLHSQLLWLLGRNVERGDEQAAFECVRRAVEVVPNDKESWQELARLADKLGDKTWSERARAELSRLGQKP